MTEVQVGAASIPSDAPQIDWLAARRDDHGDVYPGDFQFSPRTGRSLPPPRSGPAAFGFPFPGCAAGSAARNGEKPLRLAADELAEIALTNGVSSLLVAGRPGVFCLYHENHGTLEWYDAAANGWKLLGRLPPSDLPAFAHAIEATPAGLAYATTDRLVVVPLPQLGPGLERFEIAEPGLRFLCAPAWIGDALVVVAERAGGLVVGHVPVENGTPGALALEPLEAAAAGPFARPVANRVGDLTFVGAQGFVTRHAETRACALHPWPAEFEPILAQRPYRDTSDTFHQLGTINGRYVYLRLTRVESRQDLNGPHLSAGTTTYYAGEHFAVPWAGQVETLNLGTVYGRGLMIPILGLERDTILVAVDPPGRVADFIRGTSLRQPVDGYVLHHVHRGGLRNLRITLPITSIHDPAAFLMDGRLHVYSRAEGRCHSIAVQP